MSGDIQIITRSATPRDHAFIYATWLKGQYYDVRESIRPAWKDWANRESEKVKALLENPETRICVAGDAVDDLWIVGYSVSLGADLHWIYVRKDYRRRGIATLLLKDIPITHVQNITQLGAEISERKGLIFEPERISDGRPHRKETKDSQGTFQ